MTAKPPDLFNPVDPGPAAFDPRAPSPVSVEGYRARMRARLLAAGPDAIADHELLEMALFLALPRRDTKPIARALLARFGSFAVSVSAPLPDLRAVEGLGDAGAASLKLVQAAAHRLIRAEMRQDPVLADWPRLVDYLAAAPSRQRAEQFRILFLDGESRLLADEAQSRGAASSALVDPHDVAKRAVALHACALILVCYRPGGDPAPSGGDIATAKAVAYAIASLAITLHDHVIVGDGAWFSFRKEGLL